MKSGGTGAVEGDGQPTLRKRKAIVTRRGERGQEQSLPSDDFGVLVAAQAYALYVQRGYEDGHDLEDWLEAERRILTEQH